MDEEGNSIGCWMPSEFADDIKIYGRYRYRGDTLLVKGIYHIANEAHGGETEIEVNDLIVVENGEHYPPESVDMVFVYIIIVLFLESWDCLSTRNIIGERRITLLLEEFSLEIRISYLERLGYIR